MFFFVALTQEIFFRGLVFSYLKQFYPGKDFIIPLLTSSVIFGIAHLNYGGKKLFYLATIAGVFYGIIFILTNNIFFPTLCHMIINIFWKVFLRSKTLML
jgi:membrane protease YdiL (CAAX protease family)